MADGQQNSAPPKCAGGCGFFGNPACENLCSKCYRDRQQRDPTTTAATPVTAPAAPSPAVNHTPAPAFAISPPPPSAAAAAAAPSPAPMPEAVAVAVADPPASASADSATGTPKKRKKRCNVCNVKVGMLGFECRCEGLFCSKHRFADQHECSFDFKKFDRDVLAAANPTVAPSKIDAL